MKTLTLSLLLACVGIMNAQLSAHPSECTFSEQPDSDWPARITAELPSGLWKGTCSDGRPVTMQFFESGLVQWFTACAGNTSTRLFQWECLPAADAAAELRFTDYSTGETLKYAVDANCQQLHMQALKGQEGFSLVYEAAASPEEMKHVTRMLSGAWENTTFPFDYQPDERNTLEDAYLTYTFLPNGNLIRKFGNHSQRIDEKGSWTVGKDGRHIIITFEDGRASVAQLQYIQADELVLQHTISCQDDTFNTVKKAFYFNRL